MCLIFYSVEFASNSLAIRRVPLAIILLSGYTCPAADSVFVVVRMREAKVDGRGT